MTSYSSLAYFLLLVLLAVPMLVMAQRGKSLGIGWLIGASVVMLIAQYTLVWVEIRPKEFLEIRPGVFFPQLLSLAIFAVYQWVVLKLALRFRRRKTSWWAVTVALLPLASAKLLFGVAPAWVLNFAGMTWFAGISYVTFRSLDTLFLVCDGVLKEVNALDYFMYISFFPAISAGPIDRFRRFQKDWRQKRDPQKFWADMDAGIALLFRGIVYKFVIATIIERQLIEHFEKSEGWPGMIAYAYCFGIHLFFDFAGYSALAIGISRWFGVETPPNFNKPFAALNIREFWNRWHMSLSFWFRDHVYSRFLLMAVKGKWFRSRTTPARLGYFVSFGLMGLWHGDTWYYLLYGFYMGLVMVIYDVFSEWKKKHPQRFAGRGWKFAGWFLTLNVVILGFWIFSGHVFQQAKPKG